MHGFGFGKVIGRRQAAKGLRKLFTVPAGANAIYALKRVGIYAGPCFRVVRLSDSATLDVGFDQNGDIDFAAALAFRGGSQLAISIWYDQSGLGNNATQPTAALRPWFRPESGWRGLLTIIFDSDPSGARGKHLILPAGVTFDRQANTAFFVDVMSSTFNNNAVYELGTTATVRSVVFTGLTAALRMICDGGGSLDIAKTPSARPIIVGHRFSATGVRAWYRDQVYNFAAKAAGTATGGRLGGSLSGANLNYRGEKLFFINYPRALTDAEAAALQAALAEAYPAAVQTPAIKIVVDGDSIKENTSSTWLQGDVRQVLARLDVDVDFHCQAVYNTTSQAIWNARAAKLGGIDKASGKNILILGVGSNDFNGGALAETVWTTYVRPYIEHAKALGYLVIVCTVLPRGTIASTPAREAERLSYNDFVRNNAAVLGYLVADYAAIPGMADPNNTAVYDPDKTHPVNGGYALMADELEQKVEMLLAA